MCSGLSVCRGGVIVDDQGQHESAPRDAAVGIRGLIVLVLGWWSCCVGVGVVLVLVSVLDVEVLEHGESSARCVGDIRVRRTRACDGGEPGGRGEEADTSQPVKASCRRHLGLPVDSRRNKADVGGFTARFSVDEDEES